MADRLSLSSKTVLLIVMLAAFGIIVVAWHWVRPATSSQAAMPEEFFKAASEPTRDIAAPDRLMVTAEGVDGSGIRLLNNMATESNSLVTEKKTTIRWTRSKGLAHAILNRREAFDRFTVAVYEEGLSSHDRIVSNQEILVQAIREVAEGQSLDGELICSQSICFYDFFGDGAIVSSLRKRFQAQLVNSGTFEENIAFLRKGDGWFRFYFIAEDFPIEVFYQ